MDVLGRCLAGDAEAWTRWVGDTAPVIRRAVVQTLPRHTGHADERDADDLTQDVFLRFAHRTRSPRHQARPKRRCGKRSWRASWRAGDPRACSSPYVESGADIPSHPGVLKERLVPVTWPPVTVSVGVAAYPRDGRAVDALLGAADRALYSMKARGRFRSRA